MKKFFAIAMTAAAMISAASASVNASACMHETEAQPEPVDVRVTIRLEKEQLNGDAVFDRYVTATDNDNDGNVTYADAVRAAFYISNPTSIETACEDGCVWGHYGRYKADITDGSGKQILAGTEYYNSDYGLKNGDWVHVEPHIADVDVYALELERSSPVYNYAPTYVQYAPVALRTVKYPAGDFKPVPVPFTELIFDDIPSGKMTTADGTAVITFDQEWGCHTVRAKFRCKDTDTCLDSCTFWTDNAGLDWTAHRAYGNAQTSGGMQIAAAEETTAPAVTTAALTTSTEAVTTAAETAAAQTSAEAITTAAETSAAQAATTAASTAVSTTASAKQTSATGSTKAGSLQTGDSTPVAALLIAGLTAAGIAFAVSSRRKEQ